MNYSEYWRVNRSHIDHLELASALRSLRKVVGHLGVDTEVIWSGMSTTRSDRVELPALLARDGYPISHETMDVLTGLSIHQSLHIRDDSQHAWGYLSQMFPRMEDEERNLLAQLVDAGEDIHVDGAAISRGLWGKYVQKARSWWKRNNNIDYTIGFPNPRGLYGIWGDIVLDEVFRNMQLEDMAELREQLSQTPQAVEIDALIKILCPRELEGVFEVYRTLLKMPLEYLDPLRMLLLKTMEIVDADPVGRALCYRELWVALEPQFREWKAEIEAAESSEERLGFQSPSDAMGGADFEDGLPPELTDELERAMLSEAEDVTALIEATLKSLGATHERHLLFPAVYEDAVEPIRVDPDKELVRRLREIFRRQQEEAIRVNRGLRSGKLDARRLYRVTTTGTSFKRKEFFPINNQWDITLLLDASGSVRWSWNLIEGVYAALVKALGSYNNVEVFAYKESTGSCVVTRLFNGGGLFTTTPGGSTPSGEAILAIALKMPPGRRRMIMHVTDGLWNVGVDVWYALELCKREQIDLVTLGCGKSERAFELQYGKNFEMFESMERLPRAVESLLRRKLLRVK